MIFEVFFYLILCSVCAKQCTYASNMMEYHDKISIEQIKKQKKPTILSLMANDCDISEQYKNQLKRLSNLYPHVNFIAVDCSNNKEICSKFDYKITFPFHALYLPGHEKFVTEATLVRNEQIDVNIKNMLNQYEIYPLEHKSNIFIQSHNNNLCNDDDISIYILYESKCSEDFVFLNDWLKAANNELLNSKIGFLDCSKYSEKCSQLTYNNNNLSLPVALTRAKQTQKLTKIKSLSELNILQNNFHVLKKSLDRWPKDESGQCGNEVNYTFNSISGTLTIYGKGKMTQYDNSSVIPWYPYRDYVKSLVIENGITLLTDECFSNFHQITSVYIPNSVTSIYTGAFRNCSNLETVICNSNLTFISDELFANCSNLSFFLYLGTRNPQNPGANNKIFYGCDKFVHVYTTFAYDNNEFAHIHASRNFGFGKLNDNLNYTINLEAGSVNVTGEGEMIGYVNPLYFPWTKYKQYITTVEIGNGITKIGLNAFKNFKNLTNLILPSSLITIGNFAFDGCSSLATINFPNKLESIGDRAFSSCISLTKVEIGETVTNIGDGAFAFCVGLEKIDVSKYNKNYKEIMGILHSKNETIIYCYPPAKPDTYFYIQSHNYVIENFAFCNCSNLTTIFFGDRVRKFGNYSFCNTSLSHIYIPESVTNVSHGAFMNCFLLNTVVLGPNVKFVGNYAFCDCNITSFSFVGSQEPESGYSIFDHNKLEGVYVLRNYPSNKYLFWSFTCIKCLTQGASGQQAKYLYNDHNKSLYIYGYGNMYHYDFNKRSPWYSFSNSIETIIVMDEVWNIGQCAFTDCKHLSKVIINEHVSLINPYAFYNCYELSSIKLPQKLDYIGVGAFSRCYNLESIVIPSKIKSITGNPFGGCDKLQSITFESNTTDFVFVDDVLYSKDFSLLLYYPPSKMSKSFDIPNNVTQIDLYTFYKCNSLESVSIPSNVQYLDSYAFGNCVNLKSINIPIGLSHIYEYAFYGCSSLEKIEIPEVMNHIGYKSFGKCTKLSSFIIKCAEIESIEASVFESCNALEYVEARLIFPYSNISDKPIRKTFDFGSCGDEMSWYINTSLETLRIYGQGQMNDYNLSSLPIWNRNSKYFNSIIIDDGVESIGDFAFANCHNATTINISKTVTSIGNGAFYCNSLNEFYVDENNANFMSLNGILFSKNEEELISYPNKYNSSDYIISNSIVTIWNYAFSGCSKILSITIDHEITSIGNYSFYNCKNLNSLTYMGINEPSISNSSFEGCIQLKKVLTSINYQSTNFGPLTANKCFIEGKFDNNIKWVINFDYKNLTISGSGNLPNYSSTSFPPWDSYKSSFYLVIIEDGITGIGDYSFAGCNNITQIRIPKSICSISDKAFINCDSLESFLVDENNMNFSSFNGILFSKDQKTLISFPIQRATQSYTIPNFIESINSYAFSNCHIITSILIKHNITNIDEFAFYNCSNLSSLCYMGLIEPVVHSNAFEGCTNLNSVNAQMTYNGESFGKLPVIKDFIGGDFSHQSYWIYNETEKTLSILGYGNIDDYQNPNDVPWINFADSIMQINISDEIHYLGAYIFTKCSNVSSIRIPSGLYRVYGNVFPQSIKFTTIEVEKFNSYFKVIDGVLFSESGSTIYCYPPGIENTTYVIPKNVEIIGIFAFSNCINLNKIIMNEGIESLYYNAFCNCTNLNTFIYLGTNGPRSSNMPFEGCINLTEILVPMRYSSSSFDLLPVNKCFDQGMLGTNIKFDFVKKNEIGTLTLSGNGDMERLSAYYYPWDKYFYAINHVIIQNNITSISNYSFEQCNNLISVSIPETVTKIDSSVFPFVSTFTSIDVHQNNLHYKSINGILYTINESIIIKYPAGKPEFSFMLPNKVEIISEKAFDHCYNLISVSINSNLTYIKTFAFNVCKNLSSLLYYGIYQPDNGIHPFVGCPLLKQAYVHKQYEAELFGDLKVNKSLISPPVFESSLVESITPDDEPITNSIEATNESEPLPLATPTPKPEISDVLDVPENTNDSDLDKLLNERFEKMANHTNKNKIVIINSPSIMFNSNLEDDQFIKPSQNSEINYNGGNLNLILPDSGKVLVSLANEEANLSINGEGELVLAQQNSNTNSINIKSKSQINGSLKITVPEEVDAITLESIDLKNEGSIIIQNENDQKQVSFSVNDISATYNTNATISDIIVLNSVNLVQTATMNLNNVTLEKASINIEIFDLSGQNDEWKPLFKGNFNNAPAKVILKKTTSEKPAKNEEYTLATGMFENDICENWISKLDYGNTNFNWKKCENNQILDMENKRIVIKSVDDSFEPNDNKSKGKLNGGQIAGIVIGCIAGIAIIIIAVFCIIKHKNKNERSESQDRNDDANEL